MTKSKSKIEVKIDNKFEADLVGINSICAYAEKQPATLLAWKRDYGFPMWKDEKQAIWLSNKKLIERFYGERDLNPKTANESVLQLYKEKKLREAGNKFFNRKLSCLREISDFCNVSNVTVLDWLNFDTCPIMKSPDGNYTVNCDDLYFWARYLDFNLKFNFNYKTTNAASQDL